MRALKKWLARDGQQVDLQEGYARWAPLYPPHAHNPLMRVEENAVTEFLTCIDARCALDVGTGTGRNVPIITLTGAETIVGLDLSLPMLQHAHPVSLRTCADALRLPFSSQAFDLVTSSLMAGDLPSLAPWLGEVARVLAPGGRLIYSDFHPIWRQRGWRRTFRDTAGMEVELPFTAHTLNDHTNALISSGLTPLAMAEPSLSPGEPPLLVVVHARRNG